MMFAEYFREVFSIKKIQGESNFFPGCTDLPLRRFDFLNQKAKLSGGLEALQNNPSQFES